MLLRSALLCLFSATLVASQFTKPGVVAEYNPNTLQPMKNNLQNQVSSDDLHVIRGLLGSRQSGCPIDYAECNNPPNLCCPVGTYCYNAFACCPDNAVECDEFSCCERDQICCGGGCCDSGYQCTTVNGVRGCCPDGETCGGDSVDTPTPPTLECDLGYVLCDGEDFCCPLGFTCFRDSEDDPMCSLGGVTTTPQTLTSSSGGGPTTSSPSVSSSISRSSSTTTTPLPPRNSSSTRSPSSTSSTNSNSNTNSGAPSSVISTVVGALLASLAGVGAFILLF